MTRIEGFIYVRTIDLAECVVLTATVNGLWFVVETIAKLEVMTFFFRTELLVDNAEVFCRRWKIVKSIFPFFLVSFGVEP